MAHNNQMNAPHDKISASVRPIFIIGSYRSATSVMTWCLGQHPNILALEETNWIGFLSVHLENLYWRGTANGEHSNLSSSEISKKQFYRYFGKAVDNFIKENVEKYLEASERRGRENPNLITEHIKIVRTAGEAKSRWIDGTPENSHFVFGLNKLFPEAKFIHLLRNPKQVARSLMHFSTAGGSDYSEEDAYKTWMRLVTASVDAEKALGRDKVLRINYDDILDKPVDVIKECLSFIGEPYCEACLSPLNLKVNKSTYQISDDDSVEHNLQAEKPYVRAAFEFYDNLIKNKITSDKPDPAAYESLRSSFLAFAKQFRLEEIDKLSRWGAELDNEIKKRDRRIVELQDEVLKLGAWGRGLDETTKKQFQGNADVTSAGPINISTDSAVSIEGLMSANRRLVEELARKDHTINEICNSLSWKITSPLRAVYSMIWEKK